MYSPARKAVMAGLAALAISVLAVPGTASAEAGLYPSTQIEVCNTASSDREVGIFGRNQNDDWVDTSFGTIGKNGGCRSVGGWWWRVNRSVEVWWRSPGGKWTFDPYWVSENHRPKWCTLTVPSKSNNQCR